MEQNTLKIMTFNLRVDNPGDGINSFTNRFDRVMDTILRESPDIIGFQEVTDGMRTRLRDCIPGYTVQGCGRQADYHGESMLIAYRTADVELISLENVWLSYTPTVPGSTFGGDQSPCPRMFTAAEIKHDRVREPFWFINTHLDHWGATARLLGAAQLAQYISTRAGHIILVGDFNATPDTPEIRLLSERLTDTTAALGGTFHEFGRLLPDKTVKIDYIFADIPATRAYAVEDVPVDGQYYSDHNAVCAYIPLN